MPKEKPLLCACELQVENIKHDSILVIIEENTLHITWLINTKANINLQAQLVDAGCGSLGDLPLIYSMPNLTCSLVVALSVHPQALPSDLQ